MLVRIKIPIIDVFHGGYASPNMVAAKRQQAVKAYLLDSRLASILESNGVSFRILDQFVFAVMSEEVFVEVKLACDLHVSGLQNNIAPQFKVTYDDLIEKDI